MTGLEESLLNLKGQLPEQLSTFQFTTNIMISICIAVLTSILIAYYVWFKVSKGQTVLPNISDHIGSSKPRFRKRDKVLFYGRKMIRRVKSFAKNNQISVSGAKRNAAKKKQMVIKIARKLLQFKKEQEPKVVRREPPASFLEADWPEADVSDYRLPPEVMYMLRSVRVLGHFEKPIFLELCRFMETRFVQAGTYLFRVGEKDDSIYVLQSGKVNVYITDQEGNDYCVKEVGKGDSIHSLLSILDVLTGHSQPYKTVSAVAVVDSTVLRLPAQAFQYVLEQNPESLVRVVQIIMVRLQRVTFMALHNYLGLSYELMNPMSQTDKTLSVHTLHSGKVEKGSPTKTTNSVTFSSSSIEEEKVWKVADMHESNREAAEEPDLNIPVEEGTNDEATESGSPLKSAILDPSCPRRRSSSHDRRVSMAIPVPGGSSENLKRRGSRTDSIDRRMLRRASAPARPSRTELDAAPSDFDVACSRARVGQAEDALVAFGSPPVPIPAQNKSSEDPANMSTSPSKKANRRATIAEPVVSSTSHTYLHDDDILHMAMQDIQKLFSLKDVSLLQGKCYLRHVKSGRTLSRQGDQDASLYFVVTGQLQVLQQVVGKETEERVLFVTHPGEMVGSLAVLTGEPSFFTIRARVDSRIVIISKNDFYGVMKYEPHIVLHLGNSVVRRMSSFVRQIDFALDWMLIEAGRALFRQGDHSDCVYIVLNGRLRSVVQQPSGKKELVGEYGRGELVGIVEVLTQTERATTMMAVRDTELAQIPDELLNLIKRKHPQVVTRLIHLLGQRILGSMKTKPNIYTALSEQPAAVEPRPTAANLNTVAIIAVTDDVPLSNFTLELQHNLAVIGPTLRLTSDIITNRLGASALDSMNEYRLSSWLGQQEDIHRMVLYQCDLRMTKWTRRCITQADCILVVATYDRKPAIGVLEKQMENLAVRAQKELILLHKEDGDRPQNTAEWLNIRDWCSSHHHVRCPKRVFSKKPQQKMMDVYRRLFDTQPDRMSDFARLARFLTGTSVGLVLGGGGARGLSHIGIIRAMQEHGIPIDIVGGTSIGSFMGALWADENRNIPGVIQRAREWSKSMSSLMEKVFDLTYPVTAMFSGRGFNKSIEKVFENRQIEDLWIPYFCITTDITASRMRVHSSGSIWRYVRASMSLSGYLPPLCDPVDGHLLLDGGYVNNLPADVMKSMGAQSVFAIDVGSQDDTNLTNYGDDLSGWWLLWKKWNPWAQNVNVPNMAEVQSRLAYVSCVRQLDMVKSSDMCEYIRPPIDKFQTLQFGSFDEIVDVGYHHGATLFSTLDSRGLLDELFVEKSHEKVKPTMHKSTVPAEADFTDLAELISRIDEPRMRLDDPMFFISDGDDEFEDEEDNMSVTSEPGGIQLIPKIKIRGRAVSEGASPASTPPTGTPTEQFEDVPEFPSLHYNGRRGSMETVSSGSISPRTDDPFQKREHGTFPNVATCPATLSASSLLHNPPKVIKTSNTLHGARKRSSNTTSD